MDNWKDRPKGMICTTCRFYIKKEKTTVSDTDAGIAIGRCRSRSPTMDGWPVMFETDWCGDHKIDENKI